MIFATLVAIPTGATEIYVNPANVFSITPHPEQVGVTLIVGNGGASVGVKCPIENVLQLLRGKANGRSAS